MNVAVLGTHGWLESEVAACLNPAAEMGDLYEMKITRVLIHMKQVGKVEPQSMARRLV